MIDTLKKETSTTVHEEGMKRHDPNSLEKYLQTHKLPQKGIKLLEAAIENPGLIDEMPVMRIQEAVGAGAFDAITLDRIHRKLYAGYKAWPTQWETLISNTQKVTDFRTYYGVISGGFERLEEVKPKAGYPEDAFDDDTIEWTPAKYGKLYGYSFEASTYDDLGLLDRAVSKMGQAAARTLEYFFFYTCLDSNPTSYDGSNDVFGTVGSTAGTFANTMTSTGLTMANLETAVETMLQQTALGSSSTFTDDTFNPAMYIPKYLWVHTSQLLTAQALIRSLLDPDNSNNTSNVLQGQLEVRHTPYITPTHWYLQADPAMGANTMEAGLWKGSKDPELFYEDKGSGHEFAFDETRIKERLIFGGSLLDPRSWILGST